MSALKILNMKRFLILLLLLPLILPVSADRGLLVVNPTKVHESAQNAIIAWNGSYEILILSTKLEGMNATRVLEFIPLPSKPEVEKGDAKAFYAVTWLINKKYRGKVLGFPALAKREGVEIVLQKQIGVHNITVVKVDDVDEFRSWIGKFLNGSRSIGSIEKAVRYYTSNGFRYFVFDVVDVNPKRRDVEPIVYKFKSPFLFYPMKIAAYSDVGESYSRINLFIITRGEPNIPKPFWVGAIVEVNKKELAEINGSIAEMFDNAYLTYATYSGYLKYADEDLVVTETHIPSLSVKIARYLSSLPAVKFLRIFSQAYTDIFGGIFATMLISAFFAGIAGIVYYIPAKVRAKAVVATIIAMILLTKNDLLFILFASVSILFGFAVMIYTLERFIGSR